MDQPGKPEVWLRTNRRALAMGLLLPGGLAALVAAALAWSLNSAQHLALSTVLMLALAVPLWMMGELLYAMAHPRLAYQAGELLVYLEPTRPTRVPIDIVECFFLGQGPSELPPLHGRNPKTQNVIVRLAESATQWKHRDVRPAFGHWSDGYITIRGTWCEPITPGLLRGLNQRLAEVQRQRKTAIQQETAR